MKTAVTGANGFIGSAVVRRLLARGRDVRCLVEPGASLTNLDGLDVEIVEADITDRNAMASGLAGTSRLFHLAALYKLWLPDFRRMYDVNVEGTKTVLFAAMNAGLEKVVYTSSIAAVGDTKNGLSDESTPFNLWNESNHYVRSKWLAELDALRFVEEGLPVVIVNPAFPFGERDIGPTPTGKYIIEALKEEVPAVVDAGFNVVDVNDVAEAHVLAEEKGKVGERYILGNHNVTYREFFSLVSEIGGVKPVRLKIPKPVFLGVSWAMEKTDLMRKRDPKITYETARYTARRLWFNCDKAHKELGMPRTPLRETVSKAVSWFRENGYA